MLGGYKIERGCVIIARLGRWLNDSDHSDSILAIRLKKGGVSNSINFDTPPCIDFKQALISL